MPCNVTGGRDAEGKPFFAIMCTRGRPQKNLGVCLTNGCSGRAEVLCDWPAAEGGTCDRKICRRCAHRVGDNRDYCPEHWVESTKTGKARP